MGAEHPSCEKGRNLLERHDVVSGLYGGNALTNRFDDTSALVSQNDGERALRVLARQGVGIWSVDFSQQLPNGGPELLRASPVWQTPV